jgi:probable F420-dependent oxidoreductase
MKLGVTLPGGGVLEAGRRAREAEDLGASAVWSTEGAHNGFLPLAVAAEHTRRVSLGTAVAVAFGRSPLVFAHLAWDLQEASGARFILGLGTQKAHVERRYSVPWDSPGPKLRDGILAIRAIWRSWQERGPLDYRGRFYTFTLMTPAFSPEPLGTPPPRVYISAVNRYNCRLVGELCDGMHVHPFHSPRDLRERVLPEIETGLKASRRSRSQIELVVPVFVITGRTAEERRAAREGVRRGRSPTPGTPPRGTIPSRARCPRSRTRSRLGLELGESSFDIGHVVLRVGGSGASALGTGWRDSRPCRRRRQRRA